MACLPVKPVRHSKRFTNWVYDPSNQPLHPVQTLFQTCSPTGQSYETFAQNKFHTHNSGN